MEVKITHNGGNLKSWLCSHFQITTNADSQFFYITCYTLARIINNKT
jgi:uncharacterized protein Veg